MKEIYAYDNFEGDKGIIVANSYEEAIELYKKDYPDREIAETQGEYWSHGCFIEKLGTTETSEVYSIIDY